VIRPLAAGDIAACAQVLSRLPQWFGLPDANAAYIASLERLPGFVAVVDGGIVGFAAVDRTAPGAAEITVMAVDPARHRSGTGRALVDTIEQWCRTNGIRWLHVKTRGPSTYDDDYERTRQFYTGVGFEPLYESLSEWGPENAALVLVKRLAT
jgi:GNAT superfamily N-acetyltransferase